MAIFTYLCKEHGSFFKNLEKRQRLHPCPVCGVDCIPLLKKSGTCQVVEVMDNGLMPKAVERLVDIEQIMKDRADADTAKRGKDIELTGIEEKSESEEKP